MYNKYKQSSFEKEAAKRIKDRGIDWKEDYKDKSERVKEKLEHLIGPMSYIRWEGHDYTTDSDYFVVVGPAITKEGRKQWFSGIKKLPPDPEDKQYAPSGEYFNQITAAMSHATEKWGVPFMAEIPHYDEQTLSGVDIPRHLK